jgi:hypothetical protein
MWENPRREAPKWNDAEMIIRRDVEFPDPSIRAVGVEAATTGAHPNVLVKDDLTTEAAANSPLVMQQAIDWHVNSRALLSNPDTDLEWITCTRWAVADLPEYVMTNDPSVEVNMRWRSIVEDSQVIYPENFGNPGTIERLQREFGVRFPLLYMNNATDAALVDFSAADLRYYDIVGENVTFAEDDRDAELSGVMTAPLVVASSSDRDRGKALKDVIEQESMRKRAMRRVHFA